MKKRDYGSYLEDIIEHMNYAEEFIFLPQYPDACIGDKGHPCPT